MAKCANRSVGRFSFTSVFLVHVITNNLAKKINISLVNAFPLYHYSNCIKYERNMFNIERDISR